MLKVDDYKRLISLINAANKQECAKEVQKILTDNKIDIA